MAECPIFTPQPVRMPADRLGLQNQVKREYDQSALTKMARDIDGELNRLTTYYGCATVTFASLAHGSSRAYNIPVHGPLFGTKYAVRVFVPIDMDGLHFSGYVSGDDRVTVVIDNATGSAQQPAESFDMCVAVERFPAGQIDMDLPDAGSYGGDQIITPPVGLGQLVITGYAPTATLADNKAVTPSTGSLILTGYEPTIAVTANHVPAPGLGNLILTGYAPTITASDGTRSIETGLGNLSLTGYAPTVTQASPYTVALLHMNSSSFPEEYGKTTTENGITSLDTAIKVFGAGSFYSGGVGYITMADSADFDLGNGDFTIEFCLMLANTSDTNGIILCKAATYAGSPFLIYQNLHTVNVSFSGNGTSQTDGGSNLRLGIFLGTGVWFKMCVTRYGNVFRTFQNGTMLNPPYGITSSVTLAQNTDVVSIAADGAGTNPFSGWIDEMRITKGLARYTSSYTVQSDEFPY